MRSPVKTLGEVESKLNTILTPTLQKVKPNSPFDLKEANLVKKIKI
jgi:hypothetical protein